MDRPAQSAVTPSMTATGSSTAPVPAPKKAFFIMAIPCVNGKKCTI